MHLRSFPDALTRRGSLLSSLGNTGPAQDRGERGRFDGTGLYVRCSKPLWKTQISTGPYVLLNCRLSGFYVRFDGILRAAFLYIPVVQVENL